MKISDLKLAIPLQVDIKLCNFDMLKVVRPALQYNMNCSDNYSHRQHDGLNAASGEVEANP